MFKKLFLVIIVATFLMTACDPIKDVNLNQMFLNNLSIKSSQNYSVISLNLAYNSSNVEDIEYLKVLNLLNNMKIHVQTKMENPNTFSIGGFIELKQGKIPFQVYSDKKQIVVLIDQASKAIRIPMQQNGVNNERLVRDLQAKVIPAVLNDLPNPNQINVRKNVTYKVHGEDLKGHKIHAEINASEVPNLFLKFLNNLSKDQQALKQITVAFNKISKTAGDETVISAEELKMFIQQVKDGFNEYLPMMKEAGAFDKRNFLKTDILLDQNFHERKSHTEIVLKHLPPEIGGLEGIRINVTSEIWDINKNVEAQKINRTEFLREDASFEDFLSTLDKKQSVLYKVVESFNN